MDLRETISVGGVTVFLQPYTEKRRKQMDDIQNQIIEWLKGHDGKDPWDKLPIKEKAKWWKLKAQVLWEPSPTEEQQKSDVWDSNAGFFSDEFFMSDEFEYPILQKSESFFFTQRIYL